MSSRVIRALMDAGVPERVAQAIALDFDPAREPVTVYLERISLNIYDAAGEFGVPSSSQRALRAQERAS